jgi:hypothetical protein
MGCQTAIAGQSQDQGGDYLLALKGNHTEAYTAVKQYFYQHIEHQLAWRTAENFFDACDDSHGRTVRRRVWTITDLVALPELAKWPGLQAVIVVESNSRCDHPACPRNGQPWGASLGSPFPLLAQEVLELLHQFLRVEVFVTQGARRLVTRRVIVLL